MDIKKLLIGLIRNTAIVFGLFWFIFVLPKTSIDIFKTETTIESDDVITIEEGKVRINGETIEEDVSKNTYVFTKAELQAKYDQAVAEVVQYSNEVNIIGDATVYLKYLQNKETIVCVYSNLYRFDAVGLNETNVVIESLNKILGINIVLVPVSHYAEDNGLTTIRELIASGVADIGVYPQFPYQSEVHLDDKGFELSEPYAINKMYALSAGDDTEVNLKTDKIAVVNTIDDYDSTILGDTAVVVSKEKALEMLNNYEVNHIIDASSKDLEYYIDNGLYMNVVQDEKLIGLNYLIAKEDYAKELLNIMDYLLSKESLDEIAEFGEKKYNYTTVEYLYKTKNSIAFYELNDGYVDLAFSEHIGLIDFGEGNTVEGYSVDIMKYLSKALDVDFRLHNYTDLGYSNMINALNQGSVDGILNSILPTSTNNIYRVDDSTNTLPYLSYRFDIQMKVGSKFVSTLDDLNFKKIGVIANEVDAIEMFLKYKLRDSGSINLTVYDDYTSLVNGLEKGNIDYIMAYPGFTKFMQDNEQFWSVDAYNENSFRGFNLNDFFLELKTNDQQMIELTSLLNRGITSISREELKEKWFYTDSIYEFVIQEDMQKNTLNMLILIVAAIIIISAITTLIQQEKTDSYLNHILLIDNITGFGNRFAYNKGIENNEALYFIKMRIPNFKFKISSMSDREVEKLYKTIANRISEYDKDYEKAQHFHFLEDEFIILIPYLDDFDINDYIEGLLSVLKAVYVIKDRQVELKIQLVALFNELIYYDNSKLIMYCSSILDSNGNAERNSATVLTSGMLQRLKKVEILDEMLSRDLEEIFVPYYTPIISVETKEVIGVEVIGRMNSRNISLSRHEYIEHTSESGLLGIAQRILIYKMLEDREKLIKAGVIDEKFIFSFYGSEELMTKHGDELIEEMNDLGVYDLSFLQLLIPEAELTKSAIVEKVKIAQASKIKIVVDDFNVGHSSLGKIIALKLDGVKIQHHFIDDNGKSFETSLFESLIKMVSEINVPINVADIENGSDYHYVLSNDVQYLQGPYFVRPLPYKYIKKYLEENIIDFENVDFFREEKFKL